MRAPLLPNHPALTCPLPPLDQLFLMVNVNSPAESTPITAGAKGGNEEADETDDSSRALNRQEWIQCLVRIAIMRYVLPKKVTTTLSERVILPPKT